MEHFNLRVIFALKLRSRQGDHRGEKRTSWAFCSAVCSPYHSCLGPFLNDFQYWERQRQFQPILCAFYLIVEEYHHCNDMEIMNDFWRLFRHKRNLMGVALILLFIPLEKDESAPCILNAVWSERNAGSAQDYLLGYTSW